MQWLPFLQTVFPVYWGRMLYSLDVCFGPQPVYTSCYVYYCILFIPQQFARLLLLWWTMFSHPAAVLPVLSAAERLIILLINLVNVIT